MKTGNALGGFQEFLTGILSSKLTVAPSLDGKAVKVPWQSPYILCQNWVVHTSCLPECLPRLQLQRLSESRISSTTFYDGYHWNTLISSDCVNLWLRRSNNREKDISVRIRVQIFRKCCKNISGYFHFHSLKSLKDPSEHPSTPPKNQATPNFPLTLSPFLLQTSSGMIENKSISQRNVGEFFFFLKLQTFLF